MDANQFRKYGHELIDWIADYHENLAKYPVTPETKPNAVKDALPDEAPLDGEPWENIQKDIDNLIVPNITHWSHPNFHAFFPANGSYPSILGELLSAGLGVQGMLWVTSPACTEVEVKVMDWLGKMINLPHQFLSTSTGGGVIQGTASEAVLVGVVAARHRALKQRGLENDATAASKLTVYCTSQTHSCVKKACMIAGVHASHLRTLDVDPTTLALKPETFAAAIKADLENGLIPAFMCATIGTTSTTAVDPIEALGQICRENKIWYHIDAAYAGSAMICPEYQHNMKGVELADSFCFNPHKWLRVNFDCSAFWVQDRGLLVESLSVMPEYLRNKQTEAGAVIDYRDWQVPLGRRFRALKLWFTLRTYGQKNMQEFVRSHIQHAKELEKWVRADERFEVVFPSEFALVCLRLKASNELNQKLLERINATHKYYLTHTIIQDKYIIRFSIGSSSTTLEHVRQCWNDIQLLAGELLA